MPNDVKFSKENGCGFCDGKSITKFHPKDIESKFYCDNCKAIYYSLDDRDSDIAGTFTGQYAELNKNNLYENSFAKEANTIKNEEEKEEK